MTFTFSMCTSYTQLKKIIAIYIVCCVKTCQLSFPGTLRARCCHPTAIFIIPMVRRVHCEIDRISSINVNTMSAPPKTIRPGQKSPRQVITQNEKNVSSNYNNLIHPVNTFLTLRQLSLYRGMAERAYRRDLARDGIAGVAAAKFTWLGASSRCCCCRCWFNDHRPSLDQPRSESASGLSSPTHAPRAVPARVFCRAERERDRERDRAVPPAPPPPPKLSILQIWKYRQRESFDKAMDYVDMVAKVFFSVGAGLWRRWF